MNYKIMNYELNNPYDILLSGWEFDFQTRLLWMPGLLKGLVFNANYTISDSEVEYPLTVLNLSLTGVHQQEFQNRYYLHRSFAGSTRPNY